MSSTVQGGQRGKAACHHGSPEIRDAIVPYGAFLAHQMCKLRLGEWFMVLVSEFRITGIIAEMILEDSLIHSHILNPAAVCGRLCGHLKVGCTRKLGFC